MLNPKDINKLTDYSYNKSSLENRKELKQRMDTDPEFKKEATSYFSLFRGFKALELEALDQKMNEWEAQHGSAAPKPKIIRMNKFFKYASAAILLLAFLPLGYQYLNSGMTSEELFLENFSHGNVINILASHRGAVTSPHAQKSDAQPEKTKEELDQAKVEKIFGKGISAYNAHRYADAIEYFDTYITTTTTTTQTKGQAELYLAISYLAQGQTANAKPLFAKIIEKNTNNARKANAEWYLVLTLIKENKVEQAKKNLKNILNEKESHTHKEKALKLQQQIDRYYVQ